MSADAATVRARRGTAPIDRVAYPLGEAARILGVSPKTLKRVYLAEKGTARRLGRSIMLPASWVAAYGEPPVRDMTAEEGAA